MLRAALASPGARFFVAHAQSCLGSGLAHVALPLLAYDRLGSPWAVAAVLLPDLLPAIVLGPRARRAGRPRRLARVRDRSPTSCAALAFGCDGLAQLAAGDDRRRRAGRASGTALFAPAALAGLHAAGAGRAAPARRWACSARSTTSG